MARTVVVKGKHGGGQALWNVRGVRREYRKMAKDGAAMRGVSMGHWVELAIAGFYKELEGAREKAEVAGNAQYQDFKQTTEVVAPVSAEISEAVEKVPGVEKSRGKTGRSKKGKRCAHGVDRGYNCWQCGGLAKVS